MPELKRVRILLADDHALVRSGLRLLLEAIQGVEVIGESGDGREALDQIAALRPDVALLDVSMPGLNGVETAVRIRQRNPEVRVIMLSCHSDEEYVLAALRAGASGYLLKSAAPEELQAAVQAASRGETYLSPSVSGHVIEGYRKLLGASSGGPTPDEATSPVDRLTSRQREILQMVAEGYSTKQIAARLDLSVKTVDTHRAAVMKTLDIHDIAGLVRVALRSGLVSDEA